MINRITIFIQNIQLFLKLSLFKPLRNSNWICLKTSLLENFFSAKRSKLCAKPLSESAKISTKSSISSIVQRQANFDNCFAINLTFIKTLLVLRNTLIYIFVFWKIFFHFFFVFKETICLFFVLFFLFLYSIKYVRFNLPNIWHPLPPCTHFNKRVTSLQQ